MAKLLVVPMPVSTLTFDFRRADCPRQNAPALRRHIIGSGPSVEQGTRWKTPASR